MTSSEEKSNESSVTDHLIELIKNMSEDDQLALLRELEERQAKQKRKRSRRSYTMEVNYITQGNVYQDIIQDISPTGVFIKTKESFSLGQEISMSIPSPDHQKYITVTGKIARITPQGIGVEFKRKLGR